MKSKTGLAEFMAVIVSGGYALGAAWPNDSELPRMLITALLLAANGSLMWRVIRLSRIGRGAQEELPSPSKVLR